LSGVANYKSHEYFKGRGTNGVNPLGKKHAKPKTHEKRASFLALLHAFNGMI
jgi:hypothetical protein